jgi:hypothetical protein
MRFSTCPRPELRAPGDRGDAELNPFPDQLRDVLARRAPVEPQRHQVDREVLLQAGLRQHEAHELVGILARGARLQHEAQLVVLVRFVVDLLELVQHDLLQVGLGRGYLAALLPGARVGNGFDLPPLRA